MSLSRNGIPRDSRFASLFAVLTAFGACLLIAAPASAAAPSGPISGWQKGTEPGWVSMYEYVPAESRTEPADPRTRPLLRRKRGGRVRRGAKWRDCAAADKYGFLMILPQTSKNCWDIATNHPSRTTGVATRGRSSTW